MAVTMAGFRRVSGSSPVPDYLWGSKMPSGNLLASSGSFSGKRLSPNRSSALLGCVPGPLGFLEESETSGLGDVWDGEKPVDIDVYSLHPEPRFETDRYRVQEPPAARRFRESSASLLLLEAQFMSEYLTLKDAPNWGWWWRGMMDNASRSCSTWVAVGDAPAGFGGPQGIDTSSQLPSPQTTPSTASFLAPADLVKSVNKKLRGDYIRRRMAQNYKLMTALGLNKADLQQSHQQIFKILKKTASSNQTPVLPATVGLTSQGASTPVNVPAFAVNLNSPAQLLSGQQVQSTPSAPSPTPRANSSAPVGSRRSPAANSLSARDIERDHGKPLSKYDRNMMIFTWLQTLQETPVTSASMASVTGLDNQS
ncbi:unnamed protein product [Notodromas monacha]|uniref:Uncharacterized protein n=1 Tax=Notodromas monacha TaxID=399045 RepID=A0A7R9GCM9_9CRUS|nr:unnamed protein product [Notodromas monacha]CAG0916022.1 unnamed protein product [Notodromas monacha]